MPSMVSERREEEGEEAKVEGRKGRRRRRGRKGRGRRRGRKGRGRRRGRGRKGRRWKRRIPRK